MSLPCNSSARGPACTTVTSGDQTVTNDTLLPLSNLTRNSDSDDSDGEIWVPYLSIICLIAVCITLSFSFFRYWKRVKRRRRNIQDYIEHNIDLNRKRLFGMMRMPFDLSQEYFSGSLHDSGHLGYKQHRFHNQYQYSYDFSSPRGAMDIQRGGLQRYESMASMNPGIAVNDTERYCHQHECQHQRSTSLETKQLSCHHCFVTCPFCWPVFQSELRNLLKSTQDGLYHEHEKSIKDGSLDYKDSRVELNEYNVSRTVRIQEGNFGSTRDFSNWNVSENRNNYRPFENEEYESEQQELPPGNGARPKVGKRDSGLSLKKQKATEQFDENACSQESRVGNFHNTRVHSDSELQQPRMRNPQTRAKSRDSLINSRTVYSEDLSQASPTVLQNPHNEILESKYRMLPGTTTPSPALHPPFRETYATDASVPRSVAFTNSIFRDTGSPSDQFSPHLAENGGVINYGFQSDSLPSFSTSPANIADPKTSSKSFIPNQNVSNSDETGSPTKDNKKKKSFLKTRIQFNYASMSSSQLKERKARTFSQPEDRNSWPQQAKEPQSHSIDLSVIDIDNVVCGTIPSPGSLPIGNSVSANNDIHV